MSRLITNPYPLFLNLQGDPLQGGYLYFGVANQNPETNPLTVYWDRELTQPAAQPIRTINGFPVRYGTPSQLFVGSNYSLTVKDGTGILVASSLDSNSSLVISPFMETLLDDATKEAARDTLGVPPGVKFKEQVLISTPTTLTAAEHLGAEITIFGATAVTLPLASTFPQGTVIAFFSTGNGASVVRQGVNNFANAVTTVFHMDANDSLLLMSDGGNTWAFIGGSAALRYTSFGKTLIGNTLYGRAALAKPLVNTWTTRTPALDNDWRGVCWSPERGLFVAVAYSGTGNRVMTSPNGITWTAQSSAADNDWRSVCWSPERGLFVAVSTTGTGNRVMTSPDGITWTMRSSAADNNWRTVCWSPERGLFVAVAISGTGNRVMTSPDGITWTAQPSAADNNWSGICWSPEASLFVAVAVSGIGNRVMTSPDGITWTARSSAADNDWQAVCWSPERGLFVAVAISGTGNRVMTSPDGITWTAQPSAADNNWSGICWSPEASLFVAVAVSGMGNRVMTSPDGITWTARSSAADNSWQTVCWSPERGLFVAVSYTGVGNRVMTSLL